MSNQPDSSAAAPESPASVMTDEATLWRLVTDHREGVLATVQPDGRPQLSNVLYLVDAEAHLIRISTTSERIKARNARRDSRVALHVSGDNFWSYAVVEGNAEVTAAAAAEGDPTVSELHLVHSAFYDGVSVAGAFAAEMIAQRRVVIRIQVTRVHGLVARGGRRPQPVSSGES